jgi:hypothetical protein
LEWCSCNQGGRFSTSLIIYSFWILSVWLHVWFNLYSLFYKACIAKSVCPAMCLS